MITNINLNQTNKNLTQPKNNRVSSFKGTFHLSTNDVNNTYSFLEKCSLFCRNLMINEGLDISQTSGKSTLKGADFFIKCANDLDEKLHPRVSKFASNNKWEMNFTKDAEQYYRAQ